MTIQRPCKFCGVTVIVESDPGCPPEWANSLANMLACNRCADHRAEMNTLMQSMRKICLNLVQLLNGKKLTPATEQAARDAITTMTRRISASVCKFHRINIIYDNAFVEQIFEHPDKSGAVIAAYQAAIRVEARQQRQQHEQRIEPTNPEAVSDGDSGGEENQAAQRLQEHAPWPLAMAKAEADQPAGGAGADQRGGLPQETFLI